jgi:hypothetical protein
MATNQEIVELRDTINSTNNSLDAIEKQLEKLERSSSTNKVVYIIISLVIVSMMVIGTIGYRDSKNQSQEIADLTTSLFISNCTASNENREILRQNNINQAEGLLLVAKADETNPETADAYRKQVRESNELILDRDCEAELR